MSSFSVVDREGNDLLGIWGGLEKRLLWWSANGSEDPAQQWHVCHPKMKYGVLGSPIWREMRHTSAVKTGFEAQWNENVR
jgi:hypothetical protein